ncbi:MAG: hypothetical protein Q4C00_07340 [Bacillota bacterium]|nr:hypothetical protein [Bacillota bacterium]
MNKYSDAYYKADDNLSSEEKKYNWDVAFGLQKVDDLEPSHYTKELAKQNISGKVNLYDMENLIYSHYADSETVIPEEREADIVATRINILLQSGGVSLNISSFKSIHAFLFKDILPNAGEFRDYNISKKEPILFGETVKYTNYFMIEKTLSFDNGCFYVITFNIAEDDRGFNLYRITEFGTKDLCNRLFFNVYDGYIFIVDIECSGNCGYGTMLMSCLIEYAKEQGIEKI